MKPMKVNINLDPDTYIGYRFNIKLDEELDVFGSNAATISAAKYKLITELMRPAVAGETRGEGNSFSHLFKRYSDVFDYHQRKANKEMLADVADAIDPHELRKLGEHIENIGRTLQDIGGDVVSELQRRESAAGEAEQQAKQTAHTAALERAGVNRRIYYSGTAYDTVDGMKLRLASGGAHRNGNNSEHCWADSVEPIPVSDNLWPWLSFVTESKNLGQQPKNKLRTRMVIDRNVLEANSITRKSGERVTAPDTQGPIVPPLVGNIEFVTWGQRESAGYTQSEMPRWFFGKDGFAKGNSNVDEFVRFAEESDDWTVTEETITFNMPVDFKTVSAKQQQRTSWEQGTVFNGDFRGGKAGFRVLVLAAPTEAVKEVNRLA